MGSPNRPITVTRFTAAVAEVEQERLRLRLALAARSRELLQTRAELRALTEASPDLLIRLDPDDTILECRAGEATGPYRLMAAAVGQRLHDLTERSIATSLERAIKRAELLGSTVSVECEAARLRRPSSTRA